MKKYSAPAADIMEVLDDLDIFDFSYEKVPDENAIIITQDAIDVFE